MSKRFDPERDYEQFEEWSQNLKDSLFVDYAMDWMESVKAGTILAEDGYRTFTGYLFDQKWPAVREAREAERLSMLADIARAA